jgi:DNA-binding XRE family transcriptional regulator
MAVRVRNRLREALRDRGLTQADLAMMASLPYTTVLRLSRPGSNPPLEHALRVGAALDLGVEDLFQIDRSNEGGA